MEIKLKKKIAFKIEQICNIFNRLGNSDQIQ